MTKVASVITTFGFDENPDGISNHFLRQLTHEQLLLQTEHFGDDTYVVTQKCIIPHNNGSYLPEVLPATHCVIADAHARTTASIYDVALSAQEVISRFDPDTQVRLIIIAAPHHVKQCKRDLKMLCSGENIIHIEVFTHHILERDNYPIYQDVQPNPLKTILFHLTPWKLYRQFAQKI